jgi:hypothetical protein
MYRVPFDRLEEWSIGFADAFCVKQWVTKGVVSKQWRGLVKGRELRVVYPCVDVREGKVEEGEGNETLVWRDRDILPSISRFEKKDANHLYYGRVGAPTGVLRLLICSPLSLPSPRPPRAPSGPTQKVPFSVLN